MSNFKVLTIQNFDEVTNLEESKIKNLNEIERMNLVWKAPWRKESLEHYLQTGWCIGKYSSDNHLEAYFLAQPILFMESLTQSLWIEYLSYDNLDVGLSLLDFAYKYGRDKHLQRVLFNKDSIFDKVSVPFKIASSHKNYVEVYTTKIT
jgi:hypothetical protein